jgi:uncharacterized membrane protein
MIKFWKRMKQIRIPLFAGVVLSVAFVALVAWTAPMFPERVATHFGASGAPDAWMSKRGFVTFMLGFGLGLPLFIAVLFALLCRLPVYLVNIPNREFWFSPERRQETRWYLIGKGLWLSCLLLMLMAATHYLGLVANQSDPVRLPTTAFGIALTAFLAGMAVWMISLFRRFANTAGVKPTGD